MNRKTRNVISGILVCIASIFAVINFADIPAGEVRSFFVATILFFIGIVVLALIAVSVFKFLGWLKNRVTADDDDTREDSTTGHDSADDDRA